MLRSRSVAFMACPPEDCARLIEQLQRIDAATEWRLIAFYPLPCDVPRNMTVTVARQSALFAMRLWAIALVHRLRRLVICCHDTDAPAALQPLIQYASVFPVRHRLVLDIRRRSVPIATATVGTLVSLLAVPPLLAIAIAVTKAGLRLLPASQPAPAAKRGPTAILLPLIPDLSHTFVYREVLELKRRHPEFLVFSLERGDASVMHREAAELLASTTAVPRPTPMVFLGWYLRAWLQRPAAMANLIRFIQPHTASFGPGWIANDELCFLRLEHLHHSNYVSLGFVLAECLRRHRVGYVHVYGSTYPAVRALLASRFLGIPFSVSTFVDFDYVTPFHMLSEKCSAAQFVVTCTNYCAGQLRARLPESAPKFRVLHHAVPARYAVAPAFRETGGPPRIVYVGRFVAKKGIDTLILACALLRDWSIEFSCHLYGAGECRDDLVALVDRHALGSHVNFEGPIPNERFYTTMGPTDLFVCPCRYMSDGERDGIPVTFLEAMAAGMTVVTTPVSGIPELIADGHNGFLVPPDDPVRLAERLRVLLLDLSSRPSIGLAAKKTIEEGFLIEQSVDRLETWIIRESESAIGIVEPATDPVNDGA